MEQSKLTVKQVYNEYSPSDFIYGDKDSTNLNPKREIKFDQLEIIAKRLQEVTDDIIRKEILPKETLEEKIRASLSESFPTGIPLPRQQAIMQTGGKGNALLFPALSPGLNPSPIAKSLEQIVGLQPLAYLLSELDLPPIINCEEILKIYEIEEEDTEDTDDDSLDQSARSTATSPDGGAGGPENDDGRDLNEDDLNEDANNEELKECMKINMDWLKVILILLKILKILKIILDLVLSIIVPILDILMLAVGAWINPPNIAVIVQRIIEMITGLIIMLLAMLLQLIWNLLNLDCISDMTADLIAKIQEALSMFASLASAFNPNAIALGAIDQLTTALDPLAALMETMADKTEAWANMWQQMKDDFGNIASREFLEKTAKEMGENVIAGVAMQMPGEFAKVGQIKQQLEQLAVSSIQTALQAAQTTMNIFSADTYKKMGSNAVGAMMCSPQFVSMAASKERIKNPKKGKGN